MAQIKPKKKTLKTISPRFAANSKIEQTTESKALIIILVIPATVSKIRPKSNIVISVYRPFTTSFFDNINLPNSSVLYRNIYEI